MFVNRMQQAFCDLFRVTLVYHFRRDNGVIQVVLDRNNHRAVGQGSSFYMAFMEAETSLAINKH